MNETMWRWFVCNSWKIILPVGLLVVAWAAGCSTTHKYGITLEGFGFQVGFHCGPAFEPKLPTNSVVVVGDSEAAALGTNSAVIIIDDPRQIPGLR